VKQLQLVKGLLIASAISVIVAQPAWADATQVTAVRLNPTGSGLEIVLEAPSGRAPQVFTASYGKTFVANIVNTQLRLPSGQDFRQDNPLEGIAAVTVTQQTTNSIRVTVIGTEGLPTVQLNPSECAERTPCERGLVLSLSTPDSDTVAEQTRPMPESEPELEEDETTEPAAEAEGEEEIEILVTAEGEEGYQVDNTMSATRTDTPLLEIPQSVQVVPRQVLEDQQVIRLDEALRNVSGVVQDGGFGGTSDQFNIRGFFADTITRDGLRINSVGLRETANLERVEVIKGPSSVLLGNLEPGGTINLVTKKPLSEPYYFGELSVGSYEFYRPRIDFAGPLNPEQTLLYRLNAVYEHSDGFRDFEQDTQRYFIAPVVSWNISDATTLTIEFDYLNDERPFDRGTVAIGTGVADIPVTRFLGEPEDIGTIEEFGAGYRLEHRFSEALTLRNAFRFVSSDTFDYRAEPLDLDEETGNLSRNFRSNDDYYESYSLQTDLVGKLVTGSIEHTLLLGFDLNRRTSGGTQRRLPEDLTPDINIFNPIYNVIPRPALAELTNLVRDNNQKTNTLGIFVQDQISFSDKLFLLIGGRFDIVDQESEDNLEDSTSSQYDEAFSPRLGILYQLNESVALYANYARSFQPNFVTAVGNEILEPERGTQYETGIKAELLDNRLLATLAFYDITKTNIGTTDPDNPDFAIPVGEQTSQGIELDVIGEILPGWNAIASFGYNDTRVTQSSNPEEFAVGLRTANVPRYTASLWTTYEIQSGDLQGLGFGAGLFYVGERQGDFENTYELPSYLRTDAAIYYRRNNWRAALNFKNLFDVEYFKSVNFGRTAIEPGVPFTVIGSFEVEF